MQTHTHTHQLHGIQVASLASATFVCTLGREQQYFLNAPASREAMVVHVKEPVGSFPHDNRRKAPSPSTAQHGNVYTRVYLPDVRGGGVASYVQAGFASHDQLSASLAPPSWPQRWLAAESLLLCETPWLKPPSWHRRWLAPESVSPLEIPSQELVVSGRYSIVSHKFFECLSESLGVESASHQQSLRDQLLQSYLILT